MGFELSVCLYSQEEIKRGQEDIQYVWWTSWVTPAQSKTKDLEFLASIRLETRARI